MNKQVNAIVSVLVGLVLATGAIAANPDFSGTWVFNSDKGKNLGMAKAVSETATITQTPDKLVIDFARTFMMKSTDAKVVYDLTGKPVPNEDAMGNKAETVAKWDNGKLVVTWTSEGSVAGSKVVKTETRTLSADGNTMTVESARDGKDTMEKIYDRKPVDKK